MKEALKFLGFVLGLTLACVVVGAIGSFALAALMISLGFN